MEWKDEDVMEKVSKGMKYLAFVIGVNICICIWIYF